jgi:CheY-like chemotaxis protein
MPNLGGVQAAERIRQIDPDARIIFATGYDKDSALQNEMPSDEYTVLTKPYNIKELSVVINEQLAS